MGPYLAESGITTGTAAELDLVPLLALLIHTEDADMANMVMATGIHAAGDIQFRSPRS